MIWLWYKSARRGEKAHAFADGATHSVCGLVAREKAEHEVDPATARRCLQCRHGRMVASPARSVA